MTEELQKFEPKNLKDVISERIRSQFVELIPDDAWKAMVEKEIEDFTQPNSRNYGQVSDLKRHIKSEVEKIGLEIIQQALAKPEWRSNIGAKGSKKASENLGQEIRKHASEIFTTVFSEMASIIVNNGLAQVRNQISQQQQRY